MFNILLRLKNLPSIQQKILNRNNFVAICSLYFLFKTFKIFILRNLELHHYGPQRSCGQGNVFTPVCHSVHRGGVCLSACWDTTPPSRHPPDQTPPWSRYPPGAGTPRTKYTPGTKYTPPNGTKYTPPSPPPGNRLRHTVNERPVRILLECILVLM